MVLRRIAFTVLCALWVPSVALVLAQDAPDYKLLVGVWRWHPMESYNPDWSAVLTIRNVSDTGLVTAEWSDYRGVIPFTTQARTEAGNIRISFGTRPRFDLEYDKKGPALVGPVTNYPPQYQRGAWKTAYFRRME